jgi:NADH:ubiquinone reductase (H+-translocating)
VIGDLALILRSDGRPVPGLAPAAMQEGRHAARNVMRAVRGQPLNAFRYTDRGTLATIGREAAVAEIGRLRVLRYHGLDILERNAGVGARRGQNRCR